MNCRILLLFLILSVQVFSQEYLPAEHINTRDGLSLKEVKAILKDREGYMWFATREGLNRYDGAEWINYKHQADDSTSIDNDEVVGLLEDNDGNLIVWLRTAALIQLDFFDKKTSKFKRTEVINKEYDEEYIILWPFVTPTSEIYAIANLQEEKNNGDEPALKLLQYIGNGQFELREKDLSRSKESVTEAMNLPLSSWHIHNYNRDEYELLDIENHRTAYIDFSDLGGHKRLPIDPEGKFWFPNLNQQNGKSFDYFDLPSNVPLNEWMYWAIDNYRNIWIVSKAGRVYKYDVTKETINNLGEFDIDLFNINNQLFEDNEGTLWIPHALGITKIRKKEKYFENYLSQPKEWDHYFGKGTSTYSLIEHNKDTIYGLFAFNSLAVIDPNTGETFKRIDALRSKQDEFAENGVLESLTDQISSSEFREKTDVFATDVMMVSTDEDYIWMGEFKNTIRRFHPSSGELLQITMPDSIVPAEDSSLVWEMTMSLHIGNEDKLWFINDQGQLWSIDQKSFLFELDSSQFFHRGVIGITKTGMWICTDEVLIKRNEKNGVVGQFNLPERGASKNQIEVFKTVPYQDKVWIGTRRGLIEFDTLKETFTRYTVSDGLSSDIIYTIIPYGDDLWMGTQYGLCRFNIQTKEIKNYYEADGLTHNEFNRESALKANDGKLYFGGLNGINAFYPKTLDSLRKLESSRLVWTKFSKLNGKSNTLEILESHQLDASKPIEIYEGDRTFTFHYALLSYFNPIKNTYSYYLDGFEEEWNYAYGRNATSITYPSLPPGNYTLKIKAKDTRGNEAINELAISIIVYGPWWKSWWAISLYALILFLLIWSYNRQRTYRLKLQKKVLESTVIKRTAELEEQKERAEQSEKFKEQFLANMSHEIRTPMHGISGMTNILIRNKHLDSQDKYLDAIQKSSKNLIVILNDILDLSKIQAGKIEFEQIPINPISVLQNVVDILKHRAEEKGLRIKLDVNSDIPKQLIGDPTRLSQILLNLMGNAIKFTEKGKIHLSLKVVGERLQFKVKDSGIGISSSQLERMFESFEQANETITRKYGGTGLGLSISKQLVELQGGKIWVESEVNKGSSFFFELPYTSVEGDIELDTKISEEQLMELGASLSGIRILLAEDNALNTMIASDDLSYYIPEVFIGFAENGKIAVQEFETGQYDLILMDIQMPEMSGNEATQIIRKQETQHDNTPIPIVAMTANLLKSELKQCYESGMNGHIPKPYQAGELIGTIYKLIKKKVGSSKIS